MHTVRTVPAIGLIGQLALLAGLAATVSLGPLGWIVGVACGLTTYTALTLALSRHGVDAVGPANAVTLARAALVGGVASMIADSFVRPVALWLMVLMTAIALLLDTVDGWVARRTDTVTDLGARFDMEVDAFLILALSCSVAREFGAWVLAIGLARYVFVAAGRLLPWLRESLPRRYWAKVVAAVQGVVLTCAMADILPGPATLVALLIAGALLAQSFGHDVWWLWRHRPIEPADAGNHARDDDVAVEPEPAVGEPATSEPAPAGGRGPARRIAAWATTVLAGLLVWFALVAPTDSSRLVLGAFLRVPVEGVLLLAMVLLLPGRIRRLPAALAGVVLGLLTLTKFLDMGFHAALDRPFNPVSDLSYVGPAVGVLTDSIGRPGAIVAVIAAVLLIVAVMVLVPLAVLRLTRLVTRRRTASIRWVTAFAGVWILAAVFGLQIVPNAPIASASAAGLVSDQVREVVSGLRDQKTFAAQAAHDPMSITPGADLLSGLHGKDVIVAFVESYGRVAVQDSTIAPGVTTALDAGTARLRAAGFSARSAFLTSPTFGGISWLAHSTLQSGLWVDSQQRYDQLVVSDRFTLSGAFKRAGWHTVADVTSNFKDWPEGSSFYHYDTIYDGRNVGYQGPNFSYANMPDQYILSAFQRMELAAPDHPPVMAEIDLVSSHTPWAPLPRQVPWSSVGDGSVFNGMPAQGESPDAVWRSTAGVRAAYGQSIEYSLNTLISFVQTYGDDNLVLVLLGDHQPATIVTGPNPTHDVPVTIIAHDPAVLNRISSWNWQPGLRPGPQAPVWPMDAFRDRFLTAYGR